jgi:predicted O-methyltransferase YrrM
VSWSEVDRLFTELLVADDPRLAQHGAELSPPQGKLLYLLARLVNARAILELGTLGGYSATWLARALPEDGRVVTIEADPALAAEARGHLPDAVTVITGRAADVLPTLDGPFDLIFIDADKRSNPDYLPLVLELSRPGTLIVADNVVRDGAVLHPTDPDARGVRDFLELLAAEPRVSATAIQTVGAKGYDGFALALVTS